MSTPDQIKRMQDVISNPKRLDGIPGQMNAVHIRFDSNSPRDGRCAGRRQAAAVEP